MSSVSRTRRDMITQQMRNQKRQRATPQQATYLKKMFLRNSKPDHRAREEIGRRIDMTPRSVQIWFQNNRAKTKHQNLNSHMPTVTTSCDGHVSSVQLDYRAMTPLSNSRSNLSLLPDFPEGMPLGRRGTAPTLRHSVSQNLPTSESIVDDPNMLISCHSLSIGNWRRTRSLNRFETDLYVACDMSRAIIYYCVLHDQRWFRVEMFLMDISNMALHYDSDAEGLGHLTLSVSALPVFASRAAYEGDQWAPCGDFTNGSASTSKQHVLSGPYRQLEEQLAKIRTLSGSNGGGERIDPLLFETNALSTLTGVNDFTNIAGLNEVAELPESLTVPENQYADLKAFGEDESIESKINRLSNPFEHMQLTENPPADLVGLLMGNERLYADREAEQRSAIRPSFSSGSLSTASDRHTPSTPAFSFPVTLQAQDSGSTQSVFQWEGDSSNASPQTAPALTVTDSEAVGEGDAAKLESVPAEFDLAPYEMPLSIPSYDESSTDVTPLDVARLLYRTPGTPPAEDAQRQCTPLTVNTELAVKEDTDTGISPSQLTSYSVTSLATSSVSLEPSFSSPTSPPTWESDFEEDRYLS